MTVLLSIDPSLRSSGAALFSDGLLIASERFRAGSDGRCRGYRSVAMADDISEWAIGVAGPTEIAFEWPQVYQASKSKGDPNDLIALAAIGAAVAGFLCVRVVTTYKPREWAGTTSKSTTGDPWASPRGVRIAARLSEDERARVVDSHDVLDAVGIGLHHLGRFAKRRVLKGAS